MLFYLTYLSRPYKSYNILLLFLTMESKISLIENGNAFTLNRIAKNIRGQHNIQVKRKKKLFNAYTRDNLNMPRIHKFSDFMKHTKE